MTPLELRVVSYLADLGTNTWQIWEQIWEQNSAKPPPPSGGIERYSPDHAPRMTCTFGTQRRCKNSRYLAHNPEVQVRILFPLPVGTAPGDLSGGGRFHAHWQHLQSQRVREIVGARVWGGRRGSRTRSPIPSWHGTTSSSSPRALAGASLRASPPTRMASSCAPRCRWSAAGVFKLGPTLS